MKKIVALILTLTLLMLTLVGCGGTTASTSTQQSGTSTSQSEEGIGTFEERTFVLAHPDPPTDTDQYHKAATLFAQYVSEMTDGAVTIQILDSSQAGSGLDVMSAMQMGTIDMQVESTNAFQAIYPKLAVVDLPYIFKDRDTVIAYTKSDVMAECLEELPDETGIRILGFAEGGFRNTFNVLHPIQSLADFKGIKMRVPEVPLSVDTFACLGSNPTPMAYSETFTALQQKTIEGIELPVGSAISGNYDEVCQYMTYDGHFFNLLAFEMSEMVWDTCSAELQEVLLAAAAKASEEQFAFMAGVEQELIDQMVERSGLEVIYGDEIDKTELRAAVQPVYDQWADTMGHDFYDKAMEWFDKNG